MKKISTAFITTVDHNVGDDFVREGLKYVLKRRFDDANVEFENIHKHAPITSRFGFEKWRNQKKSNRLDKRLPLWLSKDRILNADLVVQSGAPVYWCHDAVKSHCFQNEWFTPLIRRRLAKNENAKLLNIAAGSCQTFYSDGSEFCEMCNEYIKEFYDLSTVTTLRDKIALNVFKAIDLQAPLIPCSSIFAPDEYNLKAGDAEYVVINYMPMAAHYDFGQNINTTQWKTEFKKFYEQIKETERVVFSCHDENEKEAALTIDANADIFMAPNDFLAYMKFYSRAKYGIMNRVHGAFMMAAFGRPSFVIGNDTRARMVEEIGLQSAFVHDVSAEDLLQHASDFSKAGVTFRDRFMAIKEKAFVDYMDAFAPLA
jgi:hypothetical protein